MAYEIVQAPQADRDLKALKACVRAATRDALELHLRHQPTRTSKSRIKRLRGMSRPRFRLRVNEVRVFYDVQEKRVQVSAVIPRFGAEAGLSQAGEQA